jgi:hypothetical protein
MKKKNVSIIIGLLFLMSSNVLFAQEISPLLVGTNVWYINPEQKIWDQVEECGVTSIRIGGHAYDRKMPSNETLLDWVKKIQAMGAEPIIQVSQYDPVEAASDLVHFFNIEKKGEVAPVKYWSIGNEPWLQADRPSMDTMGIFIETFWKPRAAAMKEVDPTIKIYGPDACDYFDVMYDDLFGGKNDITGKVPGKNYYYCDGLTFHRYPQGNGNPGTEGADDLYVRIVKAKKKVDEVNKQKGRTGEDALGWGITEYNSKGGPEVHTWGNGQMFGQILGACMKYEAKFTNTWSMFEHGGSRTGSDFSMIDGNGTPRASYRHMQFIAKYFTGEYLDGTSTSDNVKVFGATNNGVISVMIINREGGSKDYILRLDNKNIESDNLKLNIAAGKDLEYKDSIPELTTQVLIFDGNKTTKWTYSSDDFLNDRAPKSEIVNAGK